MKYIDADRLKAEIERLGRNWDGAQELQPVSLFQADLYELLDIIDSLQQEQPEKSKKDCNGCPHCVDRKDQYGWHFKGCFGGPYNGKFIAEIDECPLKQEQSEVDLEKEFGDFLEKENAYVDDNGVISYYNGGSFNRTCDIYPIARYFFNLGLNVRKEK